MRNCALATDIIQIRDRETNKVKPFNSINKGVDLVDVVESYLEDRKTNSFRDDAKQRLIRVTQYHVVNREISGFIEKGEFGTEEPLVDIESSNLVHTKQKDEAAMFPHYFRLILPQNSTIGILILERSGRRGVKGNFQDDFGNYLSNMYPELDIELQPLMPSQLLNMFINRGEVMQIRLVNYKIPTDIIDALRFTEEANEITTELTLKIKGGSGAHQFKKKLKKSWEDREDITEFIKVANVKYQNIKVEFLINDHKRVVSLENPFEHGASWDITHEPSLVYSNKNHPTLESLDIIAGNYGHDILDQLKQANLNV